MTATKDIQSYKVEIAEIDDQHGRLIALIEKLEDDVRTGAAAAEMGPVALLLETYVREHFSYEERLLRESGYPDYERHRHEHDVFAAHVRHLSRRVQLGHAPRCREVLEFLRHWLVRHIQGSDRKYADFLKGRVAA